TPTTTTAGGQLSEAFTANTHAGAYTVTAAASGVGTPASFSLTNLATTANHLAFGQQPTTTTATAAINPAVVVDVVDQFGNVAASSAPVTVSANGPAAFTAASTVSTPAVAGVATFNNLHLNTDGSYTIT